MTAIDAILWSAHKLRNPRFLTEGGGTTTIAYDAAQAPDSEKPLHCEADINPLFRERDRDSMRFAFDLRSLDAVASDAEAILGRLEAGTMPCDGAWPADRVVVFRRRIDAGKPA